MTTTAFDDQFTAATERHIAQPYDVTAILRQNVADLGRELQRQRERAERAEAELKAAREQEPVAYVKYKATGGNVGLSWIAIPTDAYYPREGEELYTRPIPAPAPEIPDGDDFNGTTPHLIQCMEALVRLDADGVLVPHGIGRDASKLLSAAANRLRKQTAPSVPEEWLEAAQRLIDAAGDKTCSSLRCNYPMDCCSHELIGAMDAMIDLLQSAPQASTSGVQLPTGWAITRCAADTLTVTHDQKGAVVVNRQPTDFRIFPESVLFALAEDLLGDAQ